jgi:predicted ATP-dependent protease
MVMMGIRKLNPDQLYHACAPEQIPFSSTAEAANHLEILGQSRALDAINFGVGIQKEGYNLYLAGSTGLGKQTALRRALGGRAAAMPTPPDWCYVNNFDRVQRPRALRLPPGRGQRLREGTERLVKDLLNALPAAFQSEEYRTRAQEITHEFEEREEKAFAALGEKAQEQGIALMPTPNGYTLAPVRHGQPLGAEDFDKLSDEEKERIQRIVEHLKDELRATIRQIPGWNKESAEKFDALNREFAEMTVEQCISDLRKAFADLPEVLEHLEALKRDVVAHKDDFLPATGKKGAQKGAAGLELQRYEVNILVDNGATDGAPIVYEANPSYHNLIGRIEHLAQMGTLITNFTLIKPGALHRANGGYLLLDAVKVLTSPFAWEALKRVLRAGEIRIESLEQMLSLVSTTSLEPETIPLQIKVALIGDRLLYFLLHAYDPEFKLLFKVHADFSESFERNPDTTAAYARLIATVAQQEQLRPIDRQGVARLIEYNSRLVEDGERVSLHMEGLTDMLREADYWAGEQDSEQVSAEHVERAAEERIRRADRLRERIHDEIQRGTILIDTDGRKVAQVNGLSVLQLGDFSFGQPSRITATARLGEGEVVDIERESELGGQLHSKGVMILSACLARRYARERPLSLSATLVFEQSYGMVEGDSASAAELCALLSAVGDIPISQNLAVTGSINQLGQIQAIGGVNQKIEGFFDVCRARGLTGDQGVVIPAANVQHLMLRKDVRQAARSGEFHVFAVEQVDEMLQILTGLPAGVADEQGRYPEGSVNHRVTNRLEQLFRLRQKFERPPRGQTGQDEEGN